MVSLWGKSKSRSEVTWYPLYRNIPMHMSSARTITADGREFSQTTVRIPKPLHDLAIEHQVSMSAALTRALEKKFKCDGEESVPSGQPQTHSLTATVKRVRQWKYLLLQYQTCRPKTGRTLHLPLIALPLSACHRCTVLRLRLRLHYPTVAAIEARKAEIKTESPNTIVLLWTQVDANGMTVEAPVPPVGGWKW